LKDTLTLSYINLFAVFGAIETLCALDSEATALASPKKPVLIKFSVKNGPKAVFKFFGGKCEILPESAKPSVTLWFKSPEALNDMANGKGNPLPIKGFLKLGFVLNNFKKLGAMLESYLKAPPEKHEDKEFSEISTKIMCSVVAGAICEIGNHDPVGKTSAKRIPNGDLSFEAGEVKLTIRTEENKLSLIKSESPNPRAIMRFDSLATAKGVFSGEKDAMAEIGKGTLETKGYFPIMMNLNNILNRVSIYLKD